MRRSWLLALLTVALSCPIARAQSPGPIVAVGGGGTTPAIVATTLELAGGKTAVVAVLPQASESPTAGEGSVKMWTDAGAKSVRVVSFADRDAARAILREATLIWMPGGSQSRFMEKIAGTGLTEVIHERHRAGAVVGGTSAGAAVLSAEMITGDADLKSLKSGTTVLNKGLGLLPGVLVDQHFLQRQRGNRLISGARSPHPRRRRYRRSDGGDLPRNHDERARQERRGGGRPTPRHARVRRCRRSRGGDRHAIVDPARRNDLFAEMSR